MTAPPAETLPKEIEEALAAALDASWARNDETNHRVAALRSAIAAALRPQSEPERCPPCGCGADYGHTITCPKRDGEMLDFTCSICKRVHEAKP